MNRHLYRLTVIPVELVSDMIEKQQIILVYLYENWLFRIKNCYKRCVAVKLCLPPLYLPKIYGRTLLNSELLPSTSYFILTPTYPCNRPAEMSSPNSEAAEITADIPESLDPAARRRIQNRLNQRASSKSHRHILPLTINPHTNDALQEKDVLPSSKSREIQT
jgi:hypothetical protein